MWAVRSSAPAAGSRPSALAGMIASRSVVSMRSWSAEKPGASSLMYASVVEQVGEVLLHRVGDVERQRLDRVGGIHGGGGDEDAAVDDEEVLHVVAAAPGVHHRGARI